MLRCTLYRATSQETGVEGTFKTNTLIVETPPQVTKVEARLMLSSVYGMDVDKLSSLNIMGGRQRIAFKPGDSRGAVKKDKDMKRFYVKLTSPVEVPTAPKQSLLPGWTAPAEGGAGGAAAAPIE